MDGPLPGEVDLRIALLLRNVAERGGAAVYPRRITEALLRVDPSNEYVLVFAFEEGRERFGQPRAQNIVVRAPDKLTWDQVAVPPALRRERVDVVFSTKHSIPLAPVAPRVFMPHGAEWVAYPRDYYALDRLYHRVALPLYLRSAERVITISHDSARRMLTFMPELASKLAVVHHGVTEGFAPVVDEARLAETRQRLGLPERFLLYVGQVYPHKNVAGILKALALLAGRFPHKLVIAGRPSINSQGDLGLIERLGLGDRVQITGWLAQDELPVLYSLADAFVFPSLYEGFGIPLLEAMACGCPVVTSTAGACPEVVGKAGLQVDPYSPQAIADAIARVLTDPEFAAGMRDRGLARAREFTWDRTAHATLAVLQAAATARLGAPGVVRA